MASQAPRAPAEEGTPRVERAPSRLRSVAKALGPWAWTIAAAVVLGLSLGGGLAFVRPEHRPLAPLQGRIIGSQASVTNQTLDGKPAILTIWSPG